MTNYFMQTQNSITGVVLSGGESSRMGEDKSIMLIGEQAMIKYSLEALKPFCKEVFISTNKEGHKSFQYPTISDEYKKIGPIAGIHSALKNANTDFVMILPCDSPMVKKEFVKFLILQIKQNTKAIVPKYDNNLEPLFAIYHQSILPIVELQIKSKDYKLVNLLSKVDVETIEVKDRSCFVNINTPEDYKEIVKTDINQK